MNKGKVHSLMPYCSLTSISNKAQVPYCNSAPLSPQRLLGPIRKSNISPQIPQQGFRNVLAQLSQGTLESLLEEVVANQSYAQKLQEIESLGKLLDAVETAMHYSANAKFLHRDAATAVLREIVRSGAIEVPSSCNFNTIRKKKSKRSNHARNRTEGNNRVNIDPWHRRSTLSREDPDMKMCRTPSCTARSSRQAVTSKENLRSRSHDPWMISEKASLELRRNSANFKNYIDSQRTLDRKLEMMVHATLSEETSCTAANSVSDMLSLVSSCGEKLRVEMVHDSTQTLGPEDSDSSKTKLSVGLQQGNSLRSLMNTASSPLSSMSKLDQMSSDEAVAVDTKQPQINRPTVDVVYRKTDTVHLANPCPTRQLRLTDSDLRNGVQYHLLNSSNDSFDERLEKTSWMNTVPNESSQFEIPFRNYEKWNSDSVKSSMSKVFPSSKTGENGPTKAAKVSNDAVPASSGCQNEDGELTGSMGLDECSSKEELVSISENPHVCCYGDEMRTGPQRQVGTADGSLEPHQRPRSPPRLPLTSSSQHSSTSRNILAYTLKEYGMEMEPPEASSYKNAEPKENLKPEESFTQGPYITEECLLDSNFSGLKRTTHKNMNFNERTKRVSFQDEVKYQRYDVHSTEESSNKLTYSSNVNSPNSSLDQVFEFDEAYEDFQGKHSEGESNLSEADEMVNQVLASVSNHSSWLH